ncbi:MAG TPA: pyridoxal-phosphate dependent enzyme [Patescibacteria group bacterium]|nr:pyridoxal-phosphate dependent enzyme [Patescibacteria group bacterium]
MSNGSASTAEKPLDIEGQGMINPETIVSLASDAADRIAGFIVATPVVEIGSFSQDGAQVLVKDETRQHGRSFKDRGATNGVASHSENGEEAIMTSSAGSHGISMSRAAQKYGLKADVVMSERATEEKKTAIRRYGAEVITHGEIFDDALEHGLSLAEDRKVPHLHPFADKLVIAGQATIGLELLEQTPDMTHLVLPVGGGGLLAGVASVIKEHKQGVKIIAAQVEGNTAYIDSLRKDRPLREQPVDRRFEGIAVGNIDPMTFEVAKRLVDQTVAIDAETLYKAIHYFKQEQGTLLETAGGVGLATASKIAETALGQGEEVKVITVATGANPSRNLGPYVEARARRFGWN